MIRLEDKGRRYKRFRPSAQEKIQLANNGLQWVLSSNVSAIGINDQDLIIRFHNGSIYKYPGRYYLYEEMLESNSKGRYVWVNLRRRKVPYKKIDRLPLASDINIEDELIFKGIDTEGELIDKYLKQLGMFIPESTPTNTLELIQLNKLIK